MVSVVQRLSSIWCMVPISAVCTVSTSFAKTETSTSCAASGVAKQILHHLERAFVVLDHEREELPVEVGALRRVELP